MAQNTALVVINTASRIVCRVNYFQTVATANPPIGSDETGYDVEASKIQANNIWLETTTFDGTIFANPGHDYTGEVVQVFESYHRQIDRWELDSQLYPEPVKSNVAKWMAVARIVANMIYTASNITPELKIKIFQSLEKGAKNVSSVAQYARTIRQFGAPTFLACWANLETGEQLDLEDSVSLGDLPASLDYDRFTAVHISSTGETIPPGQGDAITWS